MKIRPFLKRLVKLPGFTLVELLVVIGIIAILVATLISAGTYAIAAAKRAKASSTASQIQTAALAYYTEYSVYPIAGSATTDTSIGDTSSSALSWGDLMYSLCGNINPASGSTTAPSTGSLYYVTNSRGIAFLTMKSTDVDTSTTGYGAPLNPLPTGSEIYFNIAMDGDYDGVLGTGSSGTGNSAVTLPSFSGSQYSSSGGLCTSGVAVWANCNGRTYFTNVAWWVHTY